MKNIDYCRDVILDDGRRIKLHLTEAKINGQECYLLDDGATIDYDETADIEEKFNIVILTRKLENPII